MHRPTRRNLVAESSLPAQLFHRNLMQQVAASKLQRLALQHRNSDCKESQVRRRYGPTVLNTHSGSHQGPHYDPLFRILMSILNVPVLLSTDGSSIRELWFPCLATTTHVLTAHSTHNPIPQRSRSILALLGACTAPFSLGSLLEYSTKNIAPPTKQQFKALANMSSDQCHVATLTVAVLQPRYEILCASLM